MSIPRCMQVLLLPSLVRSMHLPTVYTISADHILPLKRFRNISRPVIRAVWYSVGKSIVDDNPSAYPKGNIKGIQPDLSLRVNVGKRSRTSRILECPRFGLHRILLYDATAEVVHVARVVHLFDQVASLVGRLLSCEDMKVVVRGVPAGMTFSPDGRTEDDEVSEMSSVLLSTDGTSLGDTRVDDEHAAHGPAGIVEHPFPLVTEISSECRLWMFLDELVDQRRDDQRRVGRRRGARGRGDRQRGLDAIVELCRFEYVEAGLRVSHPSVGRGGAHVDAVEVAADGDDQAEEHATVEPLVDEARRGGRTSSSRLGRGHRDGRGSESDGSGAAAIPCCLSLRNACVYSVSESGTTPSPRPGEKKPRHRTMAGKSQPRETIVLRKLGVQCSVSDPPSIYE